MFSLGENTRFLEVLVNVKENFTNLYFAQLLPNENLNLEIICFKAFRNYAYSRNAGKQAFSKQSFHVGG